MRLRLEWTAAAAWLTRKHFAAEAGPKSSRLAARLESAVIHVMYYSIRGDYLREIQYHLTTSIDPSYLEQRPGEEYNDLLWKLARHAGDQRMAVVEGLAGAELKSVLRRVRKANNARLIEMFAEVDAESAGPEIVEGVWKSVCSTGAADSLNSDGRTQDVDDVLQAVSDRINGWNRGERMMTSLGRVAYMSGLQLPHHACLGNWLQSFKLTLQTRIEEALIIFEAVWREGRVVRPFHVKGVRQLTVELRDIEALQAKWPLPTQEDIVRAREELAQLGV
ncbi:hypothetical protein LTR08_002471 [Meristemomyces frigidus]|nr:hypothetical protein LTR08_002471 [Meristemomyces frigidus]